MMLFECGISGGEKREIGGGKESESEREREIPHVSKSGGLRIGIL